MRTARWLSRGRARARALLGLILALAAAEWIAAARAYRTTLPAAAWRELDAHLAASDPGLLVLADPWLGPRARRELAALADPRAIAPPDLDGVARLTILGREGAGDPWTAALREAWGPRPLPRAAAVEAVGPFVLHRFDLDGASRVTFDLVALAGVEARDLRGRCTPGDGVLRCKSGEIRRAFAEVAYSPRRCLRFDLEDGAQATLTAADVALGERLRGHLGFDDFNARLRSDGPVLLQIAVDGEPLADLTFTDRQGWAAFEVPTPPGRHTLTVTLLPALAGTWGDRGYQARPAHAACLELRALARDGGGG